LSTWWRLEESTGPTAREKSLLNKAQSTTRENPAAVRGGRSRGRLRKCPMKSVLLVRPEAERDPATRRDWYEQKRPGLVDEFLDEIALRHSRNWKPETPNVPASTMRIPSHAAPCLFTTKTLLPDDSTESFLFRVLHAKTESTLSYVRKPVETP